MIIKNCFVQVVNEKFLALIEAVLLGDLLELFPDQEDVDKLLDAVRKEANLNYVPDTREDLFDFLVKRCQALIKVVLAFSPVGDGFRIRATRFPSLISRTTVDWFHHWPRDALERVAERFLEDSFEKDVSVLAIHLANQFVSVGEASAKYRKTQRRSVTFRLQVHQFLSLKLS